MSLWDDNEFPLAHFITFRTYGSWLHGDERGSIDRYHNKFRGPRVAANQVLLNQQNKKLKSEPVVLDSRQRPVVESAIREVCVHRGWKLLAINVRTNHIHIVVFLADKSPEAALRDFKAYATRELRAAGCWLLDHGPWVDGGSKRFLWRESSVHAACEYVINGQGADQPDSF